MRTLRRCCLLCLMLCYAGLGLAAEPLQLYTEEYPPLNFSQAGKPAGLGVEVVEEILRRTGQQASIEVVPWARGYQATLSQPNTGLFVAMRTEEREQLFKWVGPIIVGVTSFYALKGSGLTIASLEDARKVGTIAVPRQWYSYQTLEAKGLPNLYGVIGPKQMMTMLHHRRVPVVVADNVTLESLLALGDLKPTDVEPLYSFLRSYAYIAFSPSTDDALIAQWQTTLDAMKADGSFAAIYQRWLPGQEMPD
ncbi:substrate-binding periplasmic protein [Aquipseudomonas guryensis]|nr:transporter substrate-binding domain-containing protein [Pseudomonas guryensis]